MINRCKSQESDGHGLGFTAYSMQYAHAHGHVPVRTRVINSVHTLRRTNAPESVDSEPLVLSINLSIYESIYLRSLIDEALF